MFANFPSIGVYLTGTSLRKPSRSVSANVMAPDIFRLRVLIEVHIQHAKIGPNILGPMDWLGLESFSLINRCHTSPRLWARVMMRYVGDEGRVAYNGAATIEPISSSVQSHLSVRISQRVRHHNLPSARRNDGGSC